MAEKQRGMWSTEGNGAAGDRVATGGTDSVIPSYLAVVMPHSSIQQFPKARSFPLGTDWFSSHWPGSWYRGRKGSSGKGALRRSTPRSRSMQHCGDREGTQASLSREPLSGGPPTSHRLPLLLALPPGFHSPGVLGWGWGLGGQWDLVLIFCLWANEKPLRKQR